VKKTNTVFGIHSGEETAMRISPCSTNNPFKDPVLNRKSEAKAKLYTLRIRSFEEKSSAFSRDSAQLPVRVMVTQSQKCYY
jgi:hypothetical protein